ncbi:Potassium channel KOR1 [Orchesella cincta]|uniref:Potassium channel KOR1 n=1 Tax=Orchesella cincta TaxID=48709 RepID=A0A1D2NJR9_ORCCI|nr:Potassium channel KOR1 [Orchesella cincta]
MSYIKCHWAYYDWSDGHLRYHPIKTWSRYLFKGTFFIEVAMMIPLELILAFSGSTDFFGYGPGHSWYTKLRWIRMLRFLKFIELYAIVHRIFENRTTVMFLFYLSITVLMSTLIGALAFFFACPTFGYTWTNGDEFRLPYPFYPTFLMTLEQKNIRIRYKPLSSGTPIPALPVYTKELFHARSIWERWIYGLYYIGQVLMDKVNGFILNAGFIVCQSLSADITSAQVDTDEIRAINRENLNRLAIALSREGASPAFVKYIRSAFHLSYSYTRGLQPNDLFDDLYPVLHRDLFHEYVGDVLDRVPIFLGFNDAFLNMLKRKFRIEFIPKGGLVTRAGDLDFRMYIVVRGEMWVCDRNDRWLCTMLVGDSAKRRYSAYAATNLQVLVLKAEDFATVLELFPLLRKQILRSLLDYKRESYIIKAWKWNVRDHEGYQQEQKEKTETLKLFSQQNITRIHVEGYVKLTDKEQYIPEPGFWKTIVGYGFGDTFPHYIYFASDNEKFNPVIHPSSPFIGHFHSLKSIVSFFGPILAVYHVFFYVAGRDLSVTRYTIGLGIFIDAVLWIDILLKFFTAVEIVKRKTFCKNLKKIIIHYLCRPSGFIYDFIVAFPYDLATGNEGTKLMMLRCFLSIKYFSDLWKLQDDIGVSTLKFKLTTSISFLLYLAHILACIFFWISCPQSEDLNHCQLNGWVYTFRIQFGKLHSAPFPPGTTAKDFNDLYNDPNPSHWYIISLYWVMTVLTTVGFGDITPTNFEEITLAVFCIFFGSLFLSIMLGNITTGLSSLSKAKRNFLGKVEKMLDYLKIIGLSSVAHKTLSARGVNYNDIASILPLYVQQDVYLALYHNCVTHALFFGENYDLTFVRAICSRVRHYMFLPGMRIANELEPGTGIYIVMRGAVTSFQQNPSTGTYEFIKRYEKHQVFGRIPALFPGALYNKSYRAEDKTEVLLMYHADIRQLVTKFPKWKLFLKEIIAREYPHFATQSSLKDITERKFAMDERLTKKLTDEQFMEAADMFTSDPPERTGKYSENFEAKRTADNAKKTSDTVENNEDEDAKPTISRKTQRQSFSMGSKSNSRLSVSIIAARGRMSRRPAKSFHKFSDARSYKS